MGKDRLKQIRRESDPTTENEQLEVHHWNGLNCQGGEDIYPLTRAEHAYAHYLDLESDVPENKPIHRWSISEIIKRMFNHELKELNEMVEVRSSRRRR